jgi:hypothetical protein
VARGAGAAPRAHRAAADADFLVGCVAAPIAADYRAQTASSVSLADRYAVARGADRGLVHLMNHGGRATQQYVIPRAGIRAIVRVKFDTDVLDRADAVFTAGKLVLIHTSTANAGIFTDSDVYELPATQAGQIDRTALGGNRDLSTMLDVALASYDPAHGKCLTATAK